MATGGLTDSPWLFEKLSGQSSLQASRAWGRLPLAGYPQGRLPEGDPASETFPKKATRWPTPGSRPQEDRLPEAGHEEGRLPEAGQDCTHQGCTHITVIRRGVAAVQPATPNPGACMATVRRTGQPSPVRRGTVAMLTVTPPATGATLLGKGL